MPLIRESLVWACPLLMLGRMRLRVLTFNIAHGRGLSLYQGFASRRQLLANLRGIGNFIRSARIDIAALQEVDTDSVWTRRIDMCAYLSEASDLEHAILGITTRNQGRFSLLYGNAILSRFPMRVWHSHAFGARWLGEKGFVCAEVEIRPHLFLPLLNLHLEFRSPRRRIQQIEQVVAYLEKQAQRHGKNDFLPPLVCGDFNGKAERTDGVGELFAYLQKRHPYHLAPTSALTFPSPRPRRRIDFILVPSGMTLIAEEVPRVRLSDHLPVIVELEVPTEPLPPVSGLTPRIG